MGQRKLLWSAAGAAAVIVVLVVIALAVDEDELSEKRAGAEAARAAIEDQVSASLRNAATAEESYAISHNGQYTDSIAELEAEGFQPDPEVVVTLVDASKVSYCIEAAHTSDPESLQRFDSHAGRPEPGACAIK
jgi:flagellar biosynthesis/type III secretory pathway M-ring protein FliF/YscJ